ncbi:MAG: hypothetical protein IANPNBLG_03439 [Bryobacteraceae bacterium]|nr:hypothetical protein [Bryobacteraceae bacterium]
MNLRRTLDRSWRVFLLVGTFAVAHAAAPENIMIEARNMATSGKRPQAIALLERHLREHPRDIDSRLMYGIILSWEGRYEDSRRALDAVLETSPDYTDAREALIRVEMWSDHPDRAERLAREGQSRDPGNVNYLLARVKALRDLKHEKAALELARNLLELEPGNKEAQHLREQLVESNRKWDAGVDHSYSWFSDNGSGWRESSITLKRMFPIGRVGVRFTQASRFGFNSQLMEMEAYPRVRPGTYLYLNGGFSPDRQLYPAYRFAGEVFQNLPLSMEGSFGFRRFRFNAPFTLYTGSLGRYFGDYLISCRTFLSRDEFGWSPSLQYSVRRYFNDHEKFIGFRYGRGASPFEVRSTNEIGVLKSNTFMVEFSGKLNGRWLYSFTGGISAQDRYGRKGVRQYILDGSLDYRF